MNNDRFHLRLLCESAEEPSAEPIGSVLTPTWKRPSPRRGFTLLELLIAMMLVIVLIPILYKSMQFAFEAKSHAEANVEPPRTAELVMDMIRADLSQAMQPSPTTSTTTGGVIGPFEGTDSTDNRGADADDLQFYTNAIAPQHNTAVNGEIKFDELTVMPTPNGNDHVLVRKITRDLLSESSPIPDVEVICRGVGGFNLRYYDGSKWNDSWDSTQEDNTIPAAVEVTLTLDRPNGNIVGKDGTKAFRFVRVIPLACSSATYDTNVNSGGVP